MRAQTHDSLYLVMELVEGGELYDDLSKHGAFPEHQARELTAQLLSALGYLHAQGIVHRDLKPENILLAYEANTAPGPSQPRSVDCGVPLLKLADFGLAKMIHGGSAAKTFCGTPQYFAVRRLRARVRLAEVLGGARRGCKAHVAGIPSRATRRAASARTRARPPGPETHDPPAHRATPRHRAPPSPRCSRRAIRHAATAPHATCGPRA